MSHPISFHVLVQDGGQGEEREAQWEGGEDRVGVEGWGRREGGRKGGLDLFSQYGSAKQFTFFVLLSQVFFFSPIQQLELFSSPVTALKGKFFLNVLFA